MANGTIDSHSAGDTADFWPVLSPYLLPHLTAEDDSEFWRVALEVISRDASFLCHACDSRRVILARVGACPHWLRPHQTRMTEGGGFAWPTGYGGRPFSRSGLPEHDWSFAGRWVHDAASWVLEEGGRRKGCLLLRATLPTRTARHRQAAVHTLWTPGSPVRPRHESLQFYGFRRDAGQWLCTAYRYGHGLYERAAASLT